MHVQHPAIHRPPCNGTAGGCGARDMPWLTLLAAGYRSLLAPLLTTASLKQCEACGWLAASLRRGHAGQASAPGISPKRAIACVLEILSPELVVRQGACASGGRARQSSGQGIQPAPAFARRQAPHLQIGIWWVQHHLAFHQAAQDEHLVLRKVSRWALQPQRHCPRLRALSAFEADCTQAACRWVQAGGLAAVTQASALGGCATGAKRAVASTTVRVLAAGSKAWVTLVGAVLCADSAGCCRCGLCRQLSPNKPCASQMVARCMRPCHACPGALGTDAPLEWLSYVTSTWVQDDLSQGLLEVLTQRACRPPGWRRRLRVRWLLLLLLLRCCVLLDGIYHLRPRPRGSKRREMGQGNGGTRPRRLQGLRSACHMAGARHARRAVPGAHTRWPTPFPARR